MKQHLHAADPPTGARRLLKVRFGGKADIVITADVGDECPLWVISGHWGVSRMHNAIIQSWIIVRRAR